jgi:multicomponent Na+:H+ antiporter subunit E
LRLLLALGVALAAAYVLWSGFFDRVDLMSLGAISVVVVLWIARRMGLVDREGVPLHILPRLVLYAPWLLYEIGKANLDVAKRILSPRLPIRPVVFRTKAGQRTDLGKVIYANSITLTPGTVSVDMEGDVIVVHALHHEAKEGVESGVMDRKVSWLEGGA